MKKIVYLLLVVILLTSAVPAMAGNYHRGGRGHGGGNFLPGLILGAVAVGVIDAVIQPRRVYVAPAPIYSYPPVYSPAPGYYGGGNAYSDAYYQEVQRLRAQQEQERQRRQWEWENAERQRAINDARRNYGGGYYR